MVHWEIVLSRVYTPNYMFISTEDGYLRVLQAYYRYIILLALTWLRGADSIVTQAWNNHLEKSNLSVLGEREREREREVCCVRVCVAPLYTEDHVQISMYPK